MSKKRAEWIDKMKGQRSQPEINYKNSKLGTHLQNFKRSKYTLIELVNTAIRILQFQG